MLRVLRCFVVAWLCFASTLHAQDTIPPMLFCPGNLIYNLSPGQCQTQVFFNVFATDNDPNCTPNISQIDGTGYTSGSFFPIGSITLTFQAMDCSGNTATCSFSVTVNPYVPPTPGLVCDASLNISMPATCEMWLLPSMVLEGNYGCYNDFTVNVNNTGSNYIGYYYVGQTITYMVTNNVTGNTCWGTALIEDKAGPYIQNCDSVTINCLQDVRPVSEGGDVPEPSFSDCVNFSVVYMDMFMNGSCSDPFTQIIMRIWTATDILGNVSICTQTITVERVSLANITPSCPPDITVECVPGVTPDFNPNSTGFPFDTINGTVYYITNSAYAFCDVTASYSDHIIDKCGVSYRIIRTWSVMDWCQPIQLGVNPWTCSQIIYYNDTTAPVINGPSNMTANANLPGCRARPMIPASSISDCSGVTVSILTPVGPILGNGGQVPAPGLTFGQHTLTVKATDACGNSSSHDFVVNVVDNTKPSPVCIAYTVVALNDQGYAYAQATSFDNGSTDNCCISHFRVARLSDNCGIPANLTFGEFVEFCCGDVGAPVPVVLRVFDCHGNFNECTVAVEVQDQAGPSITCPPDITVLCGQNYNDYALVGQVVSDPTQQGPIDGLATDNCDGLINITTSDDGTIACGSGLIFRTWAATDVAGQLSFCVQRITVVNNNPFTGNNILFPPDITVYGCDASTLPTNTGQPTLPPPTGCYSLVVGYTDLLLTSVPDACRKILRTWSVIDWCQYNPNNPTGPGRWDLTQTIKVIDQDAPVFSACPNRTFCNFKDDCSDLAPDLSVSATDNCTDASQIFYTWTVDLFNDGLPGPAGYATSGSGQNTTNNYPIGTHRISYSAFDGCGNVGFCSFLFTIEDCKKPTVFCNAGIIVELMQTGMVPVNVMLLEQGSSNDNCTPRPQLRFSFSPVLADSVRIFTCDDIGPNPVQVWATDLAGNQDFCTTQVIIQDNMNACGGTPLIAMSGMVATEEDQGVEKVMVELGGSINVQTYTSQLGSFQFTGLPVGQDYTVSPYLDENPLKGVTTFDLLLLHRHILGLQLLDSPYKIIAGDVNNNKVLSVSDVVDLRKLILHVIPTFPNNTSWRFVDKHYSFPHPSNPFAEVFPEACTMSNLAPNSPQPDFVAVKTGDLNGSASNLTGSDDRNMGTPRHFTATDRKVKAGELVTITFHATETAGLLAWQFTLNFDQAALAFAKLTPGEKTTAENFGLSLLGQGAITASWHQLAPISAGDESDAPQFTVTFQVLADGLLSDMLHINSRFTQAEAYLADGSSQPVSLHFMDENGGTIPADRFELYQNVPNPFSNKTVIGFQLPEASSARLTVFDVSGKIVKEVKGTFSKGYHEISLEKDELPNGGMYYYRLDTPGHTATRKMIVF